MYCAYKANEKVFLPVIKKSSHDLIVSAIVPKYSSLDLSFCSKGLMKLSSLYSLGP